MTVTLKTRAGISKYEIPEPGREIEHVDCSWGSGGHALVRERHDPAFYARASRGVPCAWAPSSTNALLLAPIPDGEYDLVIRMGWPRLIGSPMDGAYLSGGSGDGGEK